MKKKKPHKFKKKIDWAPRRGSSQSSRRFSDVSVVYGLNSVRELCKVHPEDVKSLHICRKDGEALSESLAPKGSSFKASLYSLSLEGKEEFQTKVQSLGVFQNDENVQGIFAVRKPYRYQDEGYLQDLASSNRRPGLILALDEINDPHHFGVLIRTASVCGVTTIIIPKDRSVSVTPVVSKIACGGVEHVTIVQVTNLGRTIEDLKKENYWAIGLSEHAGESLSQMKLDFDAILIVGNEGQGIRPGIQKKCDYWVHLEAPGEMSSLSASVAGSIALYFAAMKEADRRKAPLKTS